MIPPTRSPEAKTPAAIRDSAQRSSIASAGVAASIGGFLLLNWFFTEPRGTLTISDAPNALALAVFAALSGAVLVADAGTDLNSAVQYMAAIKRPVTVIGTAGFFSKQRIVAPPGFTLDNTAQAVLGLKEGGGEALRLDDSKPYVYQIVDNKLHKQDVAVATSNLTKVEVSQGLTDKTQIALNTTAVNKSLRDGIPVKVVQ